MSDWFRTYGFGEVSDQLLIGAYPLDEEDVKMLRWLGVERLLNLAEDVEYELGQHERVEPMLAEAGIEEHRLGVLDHGRLPADALESAVQIVVDWLRDGRRVYVHCRAGWQRSGAVAAGVVAVVEQCEIVEALEIVRDRKPSARPMPHQRDDLLRWWERRTQAVRPPADADPV